MNKQIHKLIFGKKNSIKKRTKIICNVWEKISKNIVMSSQKKKTLTEDKVNKESASYKVKQIHPEENET